MRLYDGLAVDDLQSLLAERSDQERTRDHQVQYVVEALAVLYEAIGPEPTWMADAECRGQTDVMFPAKGDDPRRARALCARCWVRSECEAWAANQPAPHHGFLAGMSARERQRATRAAA